MGRKGRKKSKGGGGSSRNVMTMDMSPAKVMKGLK